MARRRGYLIACSPQSGSPLLCDLLRQTGVAGRPDEYRPRFDWPGDDHAEYFWSLRDDLSTRNGVFGSKLLWFQLLELGDDIRYYGVADDVERHVRISRYLGDVQYIRLRRRSRLEQALCWIRTQKPPTPVGLDQALMQLELQEAAWDDYLARAGVEPIELAYEEVLLDPGRVVRRILDALGLEGILGTPRAARSLSSR
jgi:trehalose 2-sulfotransferase